ncbi:bifunctional glycosyltransferase/class I SAM-dependent methyltransferase [Treponema primitia]|uniref:glycosyltransferase n=1 Tax=Treponema primitia TaxID=88058 RepID=UPI00398064D7
MSMAKVSLIIRCKNEIRFIEKTLESVIDEGDELIISDSESTDGTLEVCQRWAAKYPKIKLLTYKGDNDNKERMDSIFAQVTGDYVRQFGGHDMVSKGSTQSLVALLEKNPDAEYAYSKNVVNLNADYSVREHFQINLPDLEAESPFVRTACMIPNWDNCWSMFFGLYRTDVFKLLFDYKTYSVFESLLMTDVAQFTVMSARGRLLADEKSIIFMMFPRPIESVTQMNTRVLGIINQRHIGFTHLLLNYSIEQYVFVCEMQKWDNAPQAFSKDMINIIFTKIANIYKYTGFPIYIEELPLIIPEKRKLTEQFIEQLSEFVGIKYYDKYTPDIYKDIGDNELENASIILPIVLDILPNTKSVIEFGCGVGTWLSILYSMGVDKIKGVDGSWTNNYPLKISKENFIEAEIDKGVFVDDRYDIAICLDLAEHLPPIPGLPRFISSLTHASDIILFSAAIPYQSGANHINEQWLDFWDWHFRQHGYIAVDCLRKRLWHNPDVSFSLKQNLMLFVKIDRLDMLSVSPEDICLNVPPMNLVHPEIYLKRVSKYNGYYGAVYFDTGIGFNEKEKFNITYSIYQHYACQEIILPKNTRAARFDAVEGVYCIISNLEISSEKGCLKYEVLNESLINNGGILFFTVDPQILINDVLDTTRIKISYNITVFDDFEHFQLLNSLRRI